MSMSLGFSMSTEGLPEEQAEQIRADVQAGLDRLVAGEDVASIVGAGEDPVDQVDLVDEDGPMVVGYDVPTLEDVERATVEELERWLGPTMDRCRDGRMFQAQEVGREVMLFTCPFGTIVVTPVSMSLMGMFGQMAKGHSAGAEFVVYAVADWYGGWVFCLSSAAGAQAWMRAVDRVVEARLSSGVSGDRWFDWWQRGTGHGRSSQWLMRALNPRARPGYFMTEKPDVPGDQDDLGRCVRMLGEMAKFCPGGLPEDWRARVMEVLAGSLKDAFPVEAAAWAMLVSRWEECVALLESGKRWSLREWLERCAASATDKYQGL